MKRVLRGHLDDDWLAIGAAGCGWQAALTDMRRGFDGLALLVCRRDAGSAIRTVATCSCSGASAAA